MITATHIQRGHVSGGWFNTDLKKTPVDPTEGSKMHRLYGGKSERTKMMRSITPMGFANAFYEANK